MTYRVCASCEPLSVQVFRAALRHPALQDVRLIFPDQRLTVDAPAFARVLRAVSSNRISVTSNLGLKPGVGARYLFGQNQLEAGRQIWSLSHAVHEAVHVLQDEARVSGPRGMVEAAAYVVDFVFRRRLKQYWSENPSDAPHPSIMGLEGRSVFVESLEELATRRNLVEHPRASLTRRELMPVERAVDEHYGSAATFAFDGVELR